MRRTFNLDPYGARLVFYFGEDLTAVKKLLARYNCDSDISGEFDACTVRLSHLTWLVYVPKSDIGAIAILQALVHESTHVSFELLDVVGVRDEEALAYEVDHVFGLLSKAVFHAKDFPYLIKNKL